MAPSARSVEAAIRELRMRQLMRFLMLGIAPQGFSHFLSGRIALGRAKAENMLSGLLGMKLEVCHAVPTADVHSAHYPARRASPRPP